MADITLSSQEKKQAYDKIYRELNPEKLKRKNDIYYESIRQKSFDKNPQRYLWLVAKSRAKQKNISFSIQVEDISIPEKCPITEEILVKGRGYLPNAMSLDRVDNTKGYIPGNIRVISRIANLKKSNMSEKELVKLLAYIRGEL